MLINRLDIDELGFDDRFALLTARPDDRDPELVVQVAAIIAEVRRHGDSALRAYTEQFDRRVLSKPDELRLDPRVLSDALAETPREQRQALEFAAARIRTYHEHQVAASWTYVDDYGNRLGQRITPVARAGLYVPGGKASYPSSVLMNAIPAKVAGVAEVIMMVPAPEGQLNPLVLAAAAIAGVDQVFTAGGAQAVAALAYGTASVPRVDKIVGPGNRYVAEAKRQVFGQVGIDMVAGPSEILIVADGSVDPSWVAMDLFSQAEHDEQAQAILISPDRPYLDLVETAMARMLEEMPRESIIRASLANRGALIAVTDLAEAIQLTNRIGPEHLELAMRDPDVWVDHITSAGAIFLGSMSSEALGDYCVGANHVLPTSGSARFSSPLGVYDFQKRTSLIQCTSEGAQALAGATSTLARGEGLEGHARSAELRMEAGSSATGASGG